MYYIVNMYIILQNGMSNVNMYIHFCTKWDGIEGN